MTGVSGNNRNTPPHWDIALLGLWWSCNYGAVLTSFSLHCVLSRQGYRVLLLDHAPMTMASHVNDPGSVFRTFFREEGIESIPISFPQGCGKDEQAGGYVHRRFRPVMELQIYA